MDNETVLVTNKGKTYTRKQQPVYPKVYYRIMACRRISKEDRKIAMEYIKELHKNPKKSILIHDFGISVYEFEKWYLVPQGYAFWQMISHKLKMKNASN